MMDPRSDLVAPPTPSEHHRFHYLDALRGIAALLIAFRHAPSAFRQGMFFPQSFLAVDFFFCLSGFVIAFSYEKRLASVLSFKSFAVARVIRLYPLAILGTLLGAVGLAIDLHTHAQSISAARFLTEVVMGICVLPALGNPVLFPLDHAMWTLFFELVANFVYAAAMRLRLAATWVLVIACAASFAYMTILRNHLHTIDRDYSSIGLARVGVSFTAGILIYRLFARTTPSRWIGSRAVFGAAVLTAVFVLLLTNRLVVMQRALPELGTIVVFFPAIVYLGARVNLPSRLTVVCAYLGTLSYALYILHQPLLWPIKTHAAIAYAPSHPNQVHAIVVAYAVLLMTLPWLIVQYFDAPVRRKLTDLYRNSMRRHTSLASDRRGGS